MGGLVQVFGVGFVYVIRGLHILCEIFMKVGSLDRYYGHGGFSTAPNAVNPRE